MRRTLGGLMCAAPFVGIAAAAVYQKGWWFTVVLFGIAGGLAAWVFIAVTLLDKGSE